MAEEMERVRRLVRPVRDGGLSASVAPAAVRLGHGSRGRGLFLTERLADELDLEEGGQDGFGELAFGAGQAASWLEACQGGPGIAGPDVPLVEVSLSQLLFIGEEHSRGDEVRGFLWPPACAECIELVQVLEDPTESWDVKLAAMLLWAASRGLDDDSFEKKDQDQPAPLSVWPRYASAFLPDHSSGAHVLLCDASERRLLPALALREVAQGTRAEAKAAYERLFGRGGRLACAPVFASIFGRDSVGDVEHAWLGALAVVRTRSFSATMPGPEARGGRPEEVSLLAPVADLANHGGAGEGPVAEFAFDSAGAASFEAMDPHGACFRLSLPRRIARAALQSSPGGCEVLLAYASDADSCCNDRLVENYGFCIPCNLHDRLQDLPSEHALSVRALCEVWDVVALPVQAGGCTLHRAHSEGRSPVDDRTLRALNSIPLGLDYQPDAAPVDYELEAQRASRLLLDTRRSASARFDPPAAADVLELTPTPRVAVARMHHSETLALITDVERVVETYRLSVLGQAPISEVGVLMQPLEASGALGRAATSTLSRAAGLRGSHVVVLLTVGHARVAFDFLPADPESPWTAASLLCGQPVPGVVRERNLREGTKNGRRMRRVPAPANGTLDDARAFASQWDTGLRLPGNTCATFADALVRRLTGFEHASALLLPAPSDSE